MVSITGDFNEVIINEVLPALCRKCSREKKTNEKLGSSRVFILTSLLLKKKKKKPTKFTELFEFSKMIVAVLLHSVYKCMLKLLFY